MKRSLFGEQKKILKQFPVTVQVLCHVKRLLDLEPDITLQYPA